MRLPLRERARTDALVILETTLPPSAGTTHLEYRTRTGALLRIDGEVAGAFDREHTSVIVCASSAARELTLEVERRALPTNRLPSGDGLRWRLMLRNASQAASRVIDVREVRSDASTALGTTEHDTVLWGHSHLDVAWLWNYTETRRKAMRTFANALAVCDVDPSFIFMQSQPQLYAYVEEGDPSFFERVRDAVRRGRFDASPAALWVEPDCNLISGESLLRQMLAANRYCVDRFGVEPSLAWLPDTFGFPNTLPTLLAHARIPYFASTKLQWNDTNPFPYPQLLWEGPDGSRVVGAMLSAYEGSATRARIARAGERNEPLVIGYSDGGGGPTLEQVREAEAAGSWESPLAYFDRLAQRREELPVHRDELYLEYHRGVYTTHHDVKALNAELERMLIDVEERVAWCMAVRAPRDVVDRLREQIDAAWEIVLRNQFHDVLPGTSVREAYDESRAEYERALEIVAFVRNSTESMLPRARTIREPAPCRPVLDDEEYVLDNGLIHARLNGKGALLHLSGNDAPNCIAQGNLLAAYRDRPRKWEAWNVDAGYEKRRVAVRPGEATSDGDGLTVRFHVDGSPLAMRVSLVEGEPFLRVDAALDWRADRVLLRMENWLTVQPRAVRYGVAHGSIERTLSDSPEARAKFEVPGQRFASVAQDGRGLAILTLDTYGWNARALAHGGSHIGNSLLRSPRWPDPSADRGELTLSWAFAPHAAVETSKLERAWEAFAQPARVRLFTSDDPGVLVVAVKPAADGNGVIVRLRECNGATSRARIRCGARMRSVEGVDALERPLDRDASIEGEELIATIPALGLRSLRVVFA